MTYQLLVNLQLLVAAYHIYSFLHTLDRQKQLCLKIHMVCSINVSINIVKMWLSWFLFYMLWFHSKLVWSLLKNNYSNIDHEYLWKKLLYGNDKICKKKISFSLFLIYCLTTFKILSVKKHQFVCLNVKWFCLTKVSKYFFE